MKYSEDQFVPRTLDEEGDLIRKDGEGYPATRAYVEMLIESFISRIDLPMEKEVDIRRRIDSDFHTALQLYIDNKHRKKGIKFSTYFLWWMYERTKQEYPEIVSKFES
jgi:hypothetical protein